MIILSLFFMLSLSTPATQDASSQRLPPDSIYDQASHYLDEDKPRAASTNLKSLLEHPEWSQDLLSMRKTYNNLGYSYYELHQYDSSVYFYKKSNEYARALGDTAKIIASHNSLALAYKEMGFYSHSLQNSQAALFLAERIGDRKMLAEIYNTIALLHYSLGNLDEALRLHRLSLAISLQLADSASVAMAYHNLARVYQDFGTFDSSLHYNSLSLELKNKISTPSWQLVSTLNNIGIDYLETGDFLQADSYFTDSNGLYKELGDWRGLLINYNNLADLAKRRGQPEIARAYLDSGAALFDQVDAKEYWLDNLDLRVELLESQGNHAVALEYHKELSDLRESIFQEEKLKVQALEASYQLREEELQRASAEQEVQTAQARIRSNEQLIFFLILIVGLSALFGFFVIRLNRKLAEKNLIIKDQKRDNEHRIYNLLTRLRRLLRMASENLTDPKSREVFANSEAALISAASLQEYLTYSDEETENVQLGNYLKNLIPRLEEMFRLTGQTIDFQVGVRQEVRLPVQTVLNLGLIISEIITNSVKYAFNETIILPRIEVSVLKTESGVAILVGDNGVGLPDEPNQGVGSGLIRRLAKFIGAELSVQNENGTSYTISLANSRDIQFG